jgi:hypothetical protein
MKYEVCINPVEWEIIAEAFDFDKYHRGKYKHENKLGLTREAWDGDIPLYLHDVGFLAPEYYIKISKGVVTPEPIFSIFDKENITFEEMLKEIWRRRTKIVKLFDGEENPYDPSDPWGKELDWEKKEKSK